MYFAYQQPTMHIIFIFIILMYCKSTHSDTPNNSIVIQFFDGFWSTSS